MKIIKITVALILTASYCSGQFKVRNDEFIQIGHNSYRTLSFGKSQVSSTPNNGEFALEYWNNGFNIWKPWPSTNPGNYLFFIRDDHNIGIGYAGSSQYKMDVVGDVRVTNMWLPSDEKLKTNKQPLKRSLEKILSLNGYKYNFNSEALYQNSNKSSSYNSTENKLRLAEINITVPNKKAQVGLIAQEVHSVFPELVKESDNGILSINYIALIPVLIESVKEQQLEIEKLKVLINKKNK